MSSTDVPEDTPFLKLQVELPSYSYNFHIQVPLSALVLDIKREIFKTCTGAPGIEGQRLIWRGRCLRDEEKVEEIWQSHHEPHIIHLAVHPSAWTSKPPTVPPLQPARSHAQAAARDLQETGTTPSASIPQPTRSHNASGLTAHLANHSPTLIPPLSNMQAYPLTYIIFRHNNALSALMQAELVQSAEYTDLLASHRPSAVAAVERYGFQWPSILDEDFPPAQDEAQGVRYERTSLQNGAYLTLVTQNATPTPLQAHALQVLTYTFPLLSLSLPNVRSHTSISAPADVNVHQLNHHLREMGLAPLRVGLADLPLRALIGPIIILAVRTMFLLYFFSPSKKPIFAFMLGIWVLWEAWAAIRRVIWGDLRGDADEGQARMPARNPANAAAGGAGGDEVAPGGEAGEARRAAYRAPGLANDSNGVLDHISRMNLAEESRQLEAAPNAPPAPEPSLLHRMKTFIALFILTLHPAIWDRRRTQLRRREGLLKTEMNALEARNEDDGAASPETNGSQADDAAGNEQRARARAELASKHARRPEWLREYVARVRSGEWVED